MIAIGVDPGLHETAWAVVCGDGALLDKVVDLHGALTVEACGVWHGDKHLRGTAAALNMIFSIDPWEIQQYQKSDVVVVESQQVYEGASRKGRPEDLIRLATVSGGAIHALAKVFDGPLFLNPLPREWKGNVEKSVPQARACVMLGWNYRLAGGKDPSKQWVVPVDTGLNDDKRFSDADWKNIMDAIALGIWGLKQ